MINYANDILQYFLISGHHQYRGDFANVLWLNLRLEEIHPSTYQTCGEEFAYLLNKYAFKEGKW